MMSSKQIRLTNGLAWGAIVSVAALMVLIDQTSRHFFKYQAAHEVLQSVIWPPVFLGFFPLAMIWFGYRWVTQKDRSAGVAMLASGAVLVAFFWGTALLQILR